MTTPTSSRTPTTAARGRPRARTTTVCVALTAVIGLGLVLNVGSGEFVIAPLDVVRALLGIGAPADTLVVMQFRLPRALVGLLCGVTLAASGLIFQTLVRNPLAAPDIIGITSGASLVAVAIVILGASAALVPLGAVLGALTAAFLVYLLAWRRGMSSYRLVLVGIGVNAAAQAGVSYLLVVGEIGQVSRAVVWLVGSLEGRGWPELGPLLVGAAILLPLAALLARPLDALALGEDVASVLGIPVNAIRAALLVVASGLAAVAVAAAGPIGFVAFVAPHIARRLTGRTGAAVFPAAALTGAALVVAADWVATTMLAPTQLPVGIVTSIIGGPYFLYLLLRAVRTGAGV